MNLNKKIIKKLITIFDKHDDLINMIYFPLTLQLAKDLAKKSTLFWYPFK